MLAAQVAARAYIPLYTLRHAIVRYCLASPAIDHYYSALDLLAIDHYYSPNLPTRYCLRAIHPKTLHQTLRN